VLREAWLISSKGVLPRPELTGKKDSGPDRRRKKAWWCRSGKKRKIRARYNKCHLAAQEKNKEKRSGHIGRLEKKTPAPLLVRKRAKEPHQRGGLKEAKENKNLSGRPAWEKKGTARGTESAGPGRARGKHFWREMMEPLSIAEDSLFG